MREGARLSARYVDFKGYIDTGLSLECGRGASAQVSDGTFQARASITGCGQGDVLFERNQFDISTQQPAVFACGVDMNGLKLSGSDKNIISWFRPKARYAYQLCIRQSW